MIETLPTLTNGQYFTYADLPVYPGQTISSFIGIFALNIADEGTYELSIAPNSDYDFQWPGLSWNSPIYTLIIDYSAERDGWVPPTPLAPEDWVYIYDNLVWAVPLKIRFSADKPPPTEILNPAITYISNSTTPVTPLPGLISYGETVTGIVTVTSPESPYRTNSEGVVRGDTWNFNGTEGDSITISLWTNTSFDTFLYLADNSNNVLDSDDDNYGNLNSQISNFTLPYTGEYVINATSFDSFQDTWSYNLSLAVN